MASFLPARSLPLLVLLAFVGVAYGQSASGFVNIDCGKPEGYYDTDNETGLIYSSDFEFIDTGEVHNISSEFTTSSNSQIDDLRSFPNANRNCYVLRPVTKGNKYLVRATFFYGNYDGQDRPPQFDLYLGINLWSTVKLSTSSVPDSHEIIAFATSDSMSVCLANTNTGTPFISGLELRPLNDTEYSVLFGTSRTRSLILYYRGDFGGTGTTRYPADIFDRIWKPFTLPNWRTLETQSTNGRDNDFDPPLPVMRTAATPRTGSSLNFSWDLSKASLPSTAFHLALHFAEDERVGVNTRIFNVALTDDDVVDYPFYSNYSQNTSLLTVYSRKPRNTKNKLDVSLLQTSQSTLPPILNAGELFMVLDITESETDDNDVDAINHIKALYRQQKNWMGDPCLPKKFTWDGLSCNYASSNSPRIISLNLSSSGLVGELPIFLTNLTELESLYSITNKLNEKSDVYSFGVVLLELITGHPAIIRSTENVHISRWVQPSFENGKISEIVDKAFQEDFNINSIWKALEIAFACVAPISIQRPSMSEVEILLKECFELETIQERSQNSSYVDLDTSSTISMKIASINEISITNPTAR